MLEVILFIVYGILLAVFAVGVRQLHYAFKHFRMNGSSALKGNPDDLPSISVCIPARNEMHAMTESLQRVIASDYPKLEIIVLDDMSADSTPVLVKAFAHEGVRFVEGKALPAGWLGKNHALEQLLQEASGTYILFMDVDTRLAPNSISQLVGYALNQRAKMVSVLPRREDGPRASVLFSPLRYFWELIFHRKTAPATASNAWLIERQTLLHDFQGFSSFKGDIQPESQLSSSLMATGQYRFVMGTEKLGISYEKKWSSLMATSIRLLFPLVGAHVARTMIAVLDLGIIVSPFFIILGGFVFGWGLNQIISGVISLLYMGLYGSYLRHAWKRGWWIGALLWPIIVLQEIVLLLWSDQQHTKKVVTWKGRRVKI